MASFTQNDSGFPDLQVYGGCGLDFPWVELNRSVVSDSDASLGPDGVTATMAMMINWPDLASAIPQLISWTQRVGEWPPVVGTNSRLARNPGWQHPYYQHLRVRRITSVKGAQSAGQSLDNRVSFGFPTTGIAPGPGETINFGPWSEWRYAILELEFWRPPYYILSDYAVTDGNGFQQEQYRYLDKQWTVEGQVISRPSASLIYTNSALNSGGAQGGVGEIVTHLKVTRRWYEIPETAIFSPTVIGTADSLPYNFLYTQTQTTNPITASIGTNGPYLYPAGSPLIGCVNSPIGGGIDDTNPYARFLGCLMGTLRLDGIEFIPRPLPMPPSALLIPAIASNEAASQVQYDVVFHFDYFDPLIGYNESYHGHNLLPYTADGRWYAARFSQDTTNLGTAGPFRTLFNYADFTDLFSTQ